MLTERVGGAFARPVERHVRSFAHVSPDVLTITGLALNGVARAFFAFAGARTTGARSSSASGGSSPSPPASSTCSMGA